jgi:hypothetical protein
MLQLCLGEILLISYVTVSNLHTKENFQREIIRYPKHLVLSRL